MAQQPARKAEDGSSIRQRMFSDYDQAIAKIRASQAAAAKPSEATISSPQALKQHIFPGSNGVPRNVTTGAKKENAAGAKSQGELPSNLSAAAAKQKIQDLKNEKVAPANLGAQGEEPSLHFDAREAKRQLQEANPTKTGTEIKASPLQPQKTKAPNPKN
ncbi:hypothetical protein ACQKLP_26550 [Chitinophaga sp. NPDC101104]|uniref:hypothetical protein n=1 Tax=Chitinophaga sp. NPDC101104 TaxID=3390561 RepID=UPI003D035553